MFVKIAAIIALVACVASSKGDEEYSWNGLVGKWSMNDTDNDSYYPMPQTMDAAISEGWTEITGLELPENQTGLGYQDDPRIVLIFDDETCKVMGLQIAFSVKDIEDGGVPIDYGVHPATTKQTLNGEEFWTGIAYWYQDETTNTRKIWVRENGELIEIPTNATSIPEKTSYFRKKCITWMGLHYYTINANTNCTKIFPWGITAVDEHVVGISFQVIGTTQPGNGRVWYEVLGATEAVYTLPDAPACVADYYVTYGYTSFHIFFRKDPLTVNCVNECKAEFAPNRGYNESDYEVDTTVEYTGGSNVCPIV